MKNITRKKARKVAHVLRDRVFITVNYTDLPDRTVFVYPVIGYNANGTTVTRFTLYSDKLVSKDIIAAYVIENLHHKVSSRVDTFSIHAHMIMKDFITNKPEFVHSTVDPWVYRHNHYDVNELSLISW